MTDLRYVVYIVGAALLLSIAGIVLLAATGHTTPDVLQNLAVGSLTGLVGLLVPTTGRHRRSRGEGGFVFTYPVTAIEREGKRRNDTGQAWPPLLQLIAAVAGALVIVWLALEIAGRT